MIGVGGWNYDLAYLRLYVLTTLFRDLFPFMRKLVKISHSKQTQNLLFNYNGNSEEKLMQIGMLCMIIMCIDKIKRTKKLETIAHAQTIV